MLPIAILFVLMPWDLLMLNHYSSAEHFTLHVTFFVIAIALGTVAVLWHDMKTGAARYLEELIEPLRGPLVGLSAFIFGGVHFITFARGVPVYLLFGFLLMLLGYYETASLSNDFRRHFTLGENPTSKGAVASLIANQIVILGMVFLISIVALYVALMGVVGFSSVWSVLLLTSILFLILILVKRR